ncbi:MAG: hypothetical protein ACMG57_02420 [Candidatus Dojkabacteria bacterium]
MSNSSNATPFSLLDLPADFPRSEHDPNQTPDITTLREYYKEYYNSDKNTWGTAFTRFFASLIGQVMEDRDVNATTAGNMLNEEMKKLDERAAAEMLDHIGKSIEIHKDSLEAAKETRTRLQSGEQIIHPDTNAIEPKKLA